MTQTGFRCAFATILPIIAGCAMMMPARADTNQVPRLFASSFGHEAKGNTQAALNDALQIVRVEPDNYVANLRLGWLYYQRERYAKSIRFYRKAAKLQPEAIEPRLGKMLPLLASERWADAERAARWVLQRAPHNYQAASRLAYALFARGRYRAAEARYMAVLANFPSDIDMMLGLGWTYLRQGRSAEARDMFARVLAIREDNLSAKSGLQSL